MNPYIEKIKREVVENGAAYTDCDAKSVLETLYGCYCTANPIEDEVICERFMELDHILKGLAPVEADAVFALTCALCAEYERNGFAEGVRVGVCLFHELGEGS